MKLSKFLLPAMITGASLVLAHSFSVQPRLKKKTTINNSTYTAIDAYIEQQMQRLLLSGVSFANVTGNQITHIRGFEA